MQPYEATPSEIRMRYLCEHQQLRDAASRLVEQARACDCSELRAPLSQAIATLLGELRAHLEREDAALGPVLADIDAWGPQRVARLREHRRIELARLTEMVDRLREPLREGPLGPYVLQFVAWIEAELAREESEELDAGLLRDSPVVDGLDG
jgi:hypothetical protein